MHFLYSASLKALTSSRLILNLDGARDPGPPNCVGAGQETRETAAVPGQQAGSDPEDPEPRPDSLSWRFLFNSCSLFSVFLFYCKHFTGTAVETTHYFLFSTFTSQDIFYFYLRQKSNSYFDRSILSFLLKHRMSRLCSMYSNTVLVTTAI